ncbi:MAG: signal peptidase I [Aeromonas sp.]
MANTFSLLLVGICLLTGLIWLLDKLFWAKERNEKIKRARQAGVDEKTLHKVAPTPMWIEQTAGLFPVLSFVLILRSFLFEPFQIPSGSMMPTLLVGDFILVKKFAYGLRDPITNTQLIATGKPARGDAVVFKYPLEPRVDYIKRVVGLPGDRVIYRNKEVFIQAHCTLTPPAPCPSLEKVPISFVSRGDFLHMNTKLERYREQLKEETHDTLRNPMMAEYTDRYFRQKGLAAGEWVVPAGHYFVLGDNRDNSTDSRFWGFVPEQNLVGKAVAVWMSFEFDRDVTSMFPSWVPSGVRLNRIGGID